MWLKKSTGRIRDVGMGTRVGLSKERMSEPAEGGRTRGWGQGTTVPRVRKAASAPQVLGVRKQALSMAVFTLLKFNTDRTRSTKTRVTQAERQ